MKAMIYTEYGAPEVLRLAELAQPAPAANEILVRVRATSVNYGDLLARRFSEVSRHEFNMPGMFWLLARLSFGPNKPRQTLLGNEFAGEVAAAGAAVTRFAVGEAVYGYTGAAMGATAEYLCVPEDGNVARKPAGLGYEDAAIIPYGAITAINLLKKMEVRAGHSLLVIGASGAIGSAAVQLAKHYGLEVTGVCSTPRLEFVRALGADGVIDYTRENFMDGAVQYDRVLDILGRSPMAGYRRALKPEGRYYLASFKLRHLLLMLRTAFGKGRKVICILAPEKSRDLAEIGELVEAGKLRAFLDKQFPLEELPAAHRYAESGAKQGGIAITL